MNAKYSPQRRSGAATLTLTLILLGACGLRPAAAAIPCVWEPVIGPSLSLTDDSTTMVALGFNFPFQGSSYSTAFVSSNGFMTFGVDPGALCCDADLATFLSGPPCICIAWHDMIPGPPGEVTFQSFGTYAVVTWSMVPEFSSTAPHNMQILLYQNGDITLSYDILEPVSTGHRHHGLVGITPGGGAADPGEIDFSAGLPFSSGATGTIYEFFNRGPNGATGPDADPYDLSSSSITFTGNPMGGFTATDCSSAAVFLRTVSAADATVAAGSVGHVVLVAAENPGVNDVQVTSLDLRFTGSADRTSEYTATPDPGNPTVVPAGMFVGFQFSVDVALAATLETITIDADLTGVDSVTLVAVMDMGSDLTDAWDVVGCQAPNCGDCNGDLQLTILDALVAAQHSAGLITLLGVSFTNCNVFGTLEPSPAAAVDILDALTLAQVAAGLPTPLMCC